MRKLALLTGVSNYGFSYLKGPPGDIADWSDFLINQRGFEKHEIIPCTDDRATTNNILTYLDQVVSILQPGDMGFWLFTGHGDILPVHSPDLTLQGLDQILVPFDFSFTPDTAIADWQIHEILRKLKPGVNFVAVIDACHCGGIDRDPEDRVFPTHPDIAWIIDAAADLNLTSKKDLSEDPLPVSFITACREDQTAGEDFYDDHYNGNLTHFLLQSLSKLSPDTSVLDLLKDANIRLNLNECNQEAHCEGTQINSRFL